MDRDLTLEKHLLSRSYTSDARILELLETRYSILGLQKPFLPLVPTFGEAEEKPEEKEAVLAKNADAKPTPERKISTRRDMKVYLKKTMANQHKAVKKIQAFRRKHPQKEFEVASLLRQYNIPSFEDFERLHLLWQKYMGDLLFEQKNPNLQMVLPKLSTADYNGSLVTVLESRNRHLVGVRGIVLYDAQHSFIVVVPRRSEKEKGPKTSPAEMVGGLRILAKRGSLFGFEVEVGEEVVGFTILGSRFELRAVDRSAKKFKSHNVGDVI